MTMPPLPPIPVGALTSGEEALLRAWAERYGAACAAAERERCAARCNGIANLMDDQPESVRLNWKHAAEYCAAAIRAQDS